jgi:predicted HTH transcriptional regulator
MQENKMNITFDELLERLPDENIGEFKYENIEFKRNWDQEYGKKISAIGNRNFDSEYFIIIGIEDNGKLSGFDEKWAKTTEEKVSNHLNQYLSPSLTCLGISSEQIKTSYLLVIRCINPGTVIRWNSKAFRANGTTLTQLEPHEELEISMQLPGLEDFSKQKHQTILNEKLVLQSYNRLKEKRDSYSEYNEQINQEPSKLLDLLKINQTKTAYILYGTCSFRFIVYSLLGEVLQNDIIEGLYTALSKDFFLMIKRTINRTYSYTDISLSEKAFNEGIANAIMHAAYFENNGEIMIEIFPDRITIGNLCYPESIAFANKWFSKSHKTYNLLLGEYLRTLKHVDELGLGKNVIFKECLLRGNKQPEIIIENAMRLKRWKLKLYFRSDNSNQTEIYRALKNQYKDESKAVMGLSLVLWSSKKVNEIRQYIDDEFVSIFAELIDDIHGPVFFYQEEDRLILSRWVNIILDHGQATKALSPSEKAQLYSLCYRISSKYDGFIITPKNIRELGRLGDSRSAQTQSSHILSEWEEQGKVVKVSRGIYRFHGNADLDNQKEVINSALKGTET